MKKKLKYAHRLVMGDPKGRVVRHKVCDNPPCCNPSHLRVGTQKQNINDAVAKGRMGRPKGAKDKRPRERKQECIRGHAFTPENTYVYPDGHRECRTCRTEVHIPRRAIDR